MFHAVQYAPIGTGLIEAILGDPGQYNTSERRIQYYDLTKTLWGCSVSSRVKQPHV